MPVPFLTASHRRSSVSTQTAARKNRRYAIIDNRKKDEWSGFADLLANLIEKYAAVLDIENLPEPPICLEKETAGAANVPEQTEDTIEKTKTA